MIVKSKMASSYLIEKTIVGDEFRFLLGKLTEDDQKRKISGKEFRKSRDIVIWNNIMIVFAKNKKEVEKWTIFYKWIYTKWNFYYATSKNGIYWFMLSIWKSCE